MRKTYLILVFMVKLITILSIATFLASALVPENLYYGGQYTPEKYTDALPSMVWPILGFIQFIIFSLTLLIVSIFKKLIKNEETLYKASVITIVLALLVFGSIAIYFLVSVFSAI